MASTGRIIGRAAFAKNPRDLQPCEWTYYELAYYARTPNGLLINLEGLKVTRDANGNISVNSMIQCDNGMNRLHWCGWLRNGNWSEI